MDRSEAVGREAAVVALADAQAGVVARRQLLALGLGTKAVDWRLRSHRLRPLFAGVYAVGTVALSERGWLHAALLAGGEGAVLSHETAAAWWRLRPLGHRLHVTSPTHRAARRGRLRVHEGRLRGGEVLFPEQRLRVTSIGRTLVDLMVSSTQDELERMLSEAFNHHGFVPEALSPMSGRRGAPKLRRALARLGHDHRVTETQLEREFLRIVRCAHLPVPETQVLIAGTRVDAYWPELDLVVEVDGPVHLTPAKALRDRENERALRALGLRVERVTWTEVLHQADAVVALLSAWIAAQRRSTVIR